MWRNEMREIKLRIRLKSNYKEEYCTIYNSVFDKNIGIAFYPINKEEWDILSVDQSTGLQDKNGKEIYEGDIVLTTYGKLEEDKNGLTRFGKVVFEQASFRISIKDSAVKVGFYDINKIEIIGNIYENPELLNK